MCNDSRKLNWKATHLQNSMHRAFVGRRNEEKDCINANERCLDFASVVIIEQIR